MRLQPVRLPAPPPRMYVCICNGVTDHDIRHAAEAGCRTMAELTMRTGAGSSCGSCVEMASQLLAQSRAVQALPLPLLQPGLQHAA